MTQVDHIVRNSTPPSQGWTAGSGPDTVVDANAVTSVGIRLK